MKRMVKVSALAAVLLGDEIRIQVYTAWSRIKDAIWATDAVPVVPSW